MSEEVKYIFPIEDWHKARNDALSFYKQLPQYKPEKEQEFLDSYTREKYEENHKLAIILSQAAMDGGMILDEDD